MRTISLAAGVLPDATPQVTALAAADAGYGATGVWVDLETWTDQTTRELRAILRERAILALDVEVVWLMPGQLDSRHREIVDIGRELGAGHVLVVSSDPEQNGTTAKLAALCEYAGDDLRICLEFGLFTEVKNIAQARCIVEAVGHSAAGLLIDPLHLARSGGTPVEVRDVPRQLLPYAQFCDAGPLRYDIGDQQAIISEAVDYRRLPGGGELPLRPFLDALPPNVPLSVELRSRSLREGYPDPVERARRVLAATKRLLRRSG